ncbi:hypothetical protein I4U23_024216 [Adineta vaga]|nr:hypothetical protein I4U23_024216 [Adineta vaga]
MSMGSYSIILTLIVILTILSLCFLLPWLHAIYIWQTSTIKSSNNLSMSSSLSTPYIIHQTFRDMNSIPLNWQQASNSCRSLHPNYQYKFWSDKQGRDLIKQEFPSLLSTYDSYPYNIQRADVIRLVVLYVYGGIYIDFDIFCLKSLDHLLKYEFILPKTSPVGLSNDIIISKPKHPFLFQILNNLPNANRYIFSKYPTVMFSTGPMFLTKEAWKYPNRSSLDILSPELYGKYIFNSSYSLFRHLKASSWHGNDASIIKWIYRWRNLILFVSILLLLFVIQFIQQRYLTSSRTNISNMKI